MLKLPDHFKVDYRSILRHLDTNRATIKNDNLVLFYSKSLSALDAEHIKSIKIGKSKNETVKIWIYKKINNELVLINNNQPTFNSKQVVGLIQLKS